MSTFFTGLFFAAVVFETIVVVAMIASIVQAFEPVLKLFYGHAKSMTGLGVLTKWVRCTALIATIWAISGLDFWYLALNFALDLISVSTMLWFRSVSAKSFGTLAG